MLYISKIKIPNGDEYAIKDLEGRTDISELSASFSSLQSRVITLENEERVPITTSEIYYIMYNV